MPLKYINISISITKNRRYFISSGKKVLQAQ